jgi:hypothetical protein
MRARSTATHVQLSMKKLLLVITGESAVRKAVWVGKDTYLTSKRLE